MLARIGTHVTCRARRRACRWVAAHKKALEEEAAVMKGVAGWEVGKSTSATGRWIPPPEPFGINNPIIR